MPAWAGWASASVRHSSAISPERRALLIHVLAPSMTHWSPSRTAAVLRWARSEPPRGSVSAIVARSSPVAIRGRYVCRCSSVPKASSSLATTVCPPIAPAKLIQPRASSSVTSA
jgi:hypothetical protein